MDRLLEMYIQLGLGWNLQGNFGLKQISALFLKNPGSWQLVSDNYGRIALKRKFREWGSNWFKFRGKCSSWSRFRYSFGMLYYRLPLLPNKHPYCCTLQLEMMGTPAMSSNPPVTLHVTKVPHVTVKWLNNRFRKLGSAAERRWIWALGVPPKWTPPAAVWMTMNGDVWII